MDGNRVLLQLDFKRCKLQVDLLQHQNESLPTEQSSDYVAGTNIIWEGNELPELQHHSAFSVVSRRSRLLVSLQPRVSLKI